MANIRSKFQSTALTASGNWIPPKGVTKVRATLVGGGAGGHGGEAITNGGPGGEGGCILRADVVVEHGTTYAGVIGAAGAAGTATNAGGNGGNTTMFGLTAVGGKSSASNSTNKLAATERSVSLGFDATLVLGGNGGAKGRHGQSAIGAGGLAGAGTVGTDAHGGGGGGSYGAGGAGGTTAGAIAGVAAAANSGGGGGGGGINSAGGAGGSGYILLEWEDPQLP